MNDVGDLKLSEYTTQMIQTYLMSLNIANVTRKNRKIYLNAIFRYAERIGYIDKTPVKNVVIPRVRADYEKLKKHKIILSVRTSLGW